MIAHISAPYRGKLRRVPLSDVIYLRAEHKYVTVRHLRGELLVDRSLRFFEQEFPDFFLRIHRNALVARHRLWAVETAGKSLALACLSDCEERLPISRRHVSKVRAWLRDLETSP